MAFSYAKAHEFLASSHPQIVELLATSRKLEDLATYDGIRRNIENLARQAFGRNASVRIHFFGSRIIGLATESSDLDIFVELGYTYSAFYKPSRQHDINLRKLSKIIRESRDWLVKREITRTAVPIIISHYKPLDINCDINITNGLGTANSKLLAHLFYIQPEAAALVHFMKLWFKAQGLSGLKGYTLTLLVLFYLQSISVMPSVQRVQRGVLKQEINDWEVQFNSSCSLESYGYSRMSNYQTYVKGFFDFYNNFDFSSQVISPHFGKALDVIDYRLKYETFVLKGLYIAGPVIQGRNCGIISNQDKKRFFLICKGSSSYLGTVLAEMYLE